MTVYKPTKKERTSERQKIWFKKKRKEELKEKKVQQALGLQPLCEKCEDAGETSQIYQYSRGDDTAPCRWCLKGLLIEIRNYCTINRLCKDHPEYVPYKQPTVLCDGCFDLWLGSPLQQNSNAIKNYIQNDEIPK